MMTVLKLAFLVFWAPLFVCDIRSRGFKKVWDEVKLIWFDK